MAKYFFGAVILLASLNVISFAEDIPVFYSEEVVVTAYRLPQLSSQLPVSTTIITSGVLKSLGAKNLGDALNYTFGTLPHTTGYLGSQISGGIRGSSYQQMLVLIDGQRINSPLLGGYDLGDLPLDMIERIEIVRGPASALHGADAVGGVINIVTAKGTEDAVSRVKLKTELSEMGAYDLHLASSGRMDLFDYSFTAGERFSPGYRENSDYKAQDVKADLTKNISDDLKVGAGFDYYYAYKGIPGSLTFPTPDTRQNDDDQHFRVFAEKKLYDWWDLKISSSVGNMAQAYSADPGSSPYERYKSYSSQYELQNDLKLGEADMFEFGGEYRNDESRSTLSGDHLVTNKAVFFQEQHYFLDNLSLLSSVRYDEHSIYGDTSSPRAGIIYKPDKDTSIWASYGESFRAPTLNDLYTYYVDPVWGIIMKGNASIKPESGKNTEVGLTTKPLQNMELNINYFNNKIENLIQWVDISGTFMTWEARNVASANITGYEVGITYLYTRDLKCFINYTAISATDGKTGKDLPYRSAVQYNFGLEYDDTKDNSAGILVRHVGERFDNASNSRIVDPYTVADINLRSRINERTVARLGAQNLFNEDYQDTYDYPMPGRIYTFGIEYDLL